MTYRWIGFAVGAALLGGAAWYFGRPEMPKESPFETAQNSGVSETPKELPPKLIEVIDLASAYEPIREPQSPSGIDPASFLEDGKAPSRIPYAVDDEDIDSIEVKVVGACESFCERIAVGEKIAIQPREVPTPKPVSIMLDVMPRVVSERMSSNIQNGLLNFVPSAAVAGDLVFTPMGVPFATGISQPIPPNASIHNGVFVPTQPAPVERIGIKPREVLPNERMPQVPGWPWDWEATQPEFSGRGWDDPIDGFSGLLAPYSVQAKHRLVGSLLLKPGRPFRSYSPARP